MRDPGIVPTASDAHKIPDLATPNTELIDEYGSPRKVMSRQAFMALSPGPEKIKLHLDVAASLLDLGMCTTPGLNSEPDIALDAWTPIQLPEREWDGVAEEMLGLAKHLDSHDIKAGSLVIPLNIFEHIFGCGVDLPSSVLIKPIQAELIGPRAQESKLVQFGVELIACDLVSIKSLASTLNVRQGDILAFSMPGKTSGKSGKCSKNRGSAVTMILNLEDFTVCRNTPQVHGVGTRKSSHRVVLPPKRYAALISDDVSDAETHQSTKIQARGRGRPRKLPATVQPSQAGQPALPSLTCAHCNTTETPRWWRDAFPKGVLCNACGIWLKRHGYPRPVQFFEQGNVVMPANANANANANMKMKMKIDTDLNTTNATMTTNAQSQEKAFYLINGRPKRTRSTRNQPIGVEVGGGLALDLPNSKADEEGRGSESEARCDHNELHDKSTNTTTGTLNINFEEAGDRVFVIKRTLLYSGLHEYTTGSCQGNAAGVLVHVGWAPGARSATCMYERLLCALRSIESAKSVVVSNFELLGETKAAITVSGKTSQCLDMDCIVTSLVAAL